MRRQWLVLAAVLGVGACGGEAPATKTETSAPVETAAAPAPAVPTGPCNTLSVNPKSVVTQAVAKAEKPFANGEIPDGVYDLVRLDRLDGALAWPDKRWMTVEVSKGSSGQVLNWVIVHNDPAGAAELQTSTFVAGPPAGLNYTCGGSSFIPMSWQAEGDGFTLVAPGEGGIGQHALVFKRRAAGSEGAAAPASPN